MKYSYYVHDFTNGYSSSSTAMAASGAKVQVYAGNVCYFTFNVPNEGGTGGMYLTMIRQRCINTG